LLTWFVITVGAVAAALLLQFILVQILLRSVRRHPLVERAVRRLRAPVRLLNAIVVISISLHYADDMSEQTRNQIEHVIVLVAMGAFAWFSIRLVGALVEEAIEKLPLQQSDNLRARTLQTQLAIVRRIASVLIIILAVASALWTFGRVRALGASILASAGIVGIVAGVAAKSTLGNLIAGVQIAFTAPIRLDDVVVVEGQWGKVEEITLSQVVVRTWDQRRLILPCVYFVENPFENWTRPTSDLLAPVEIALDSTVDVDDVRDAVTSIAERHPLWDQRTNVVQVTDTSTESVTVRVLLSARNASDAFDLRCDVREGLLRHLRMAQPHALPRLRITAEEPSGSADEGGRFAEATRQYRAVSRRGTR
jgi:small-conductance mechanosensitive channel